MHTSQKFCDSLKNYIHPHNHCSKNKIEHRLLYKFEKNNEVLFKCPCNLTLFSSFYMFYTVCKINAFVVTSKSRSVICQKAILYCNDIKIQEASL